MFKYAVDRNRVSHFEPVVSSRVSRHSERYKILLNLSNTCAKI